MESLQLSHSEVSHSKDKSSSLVSVVIPTRNRPEFLARALKSVAAQSYPHIEAVVVDENDPDSREREQTAEVIEHARKRGSILYLQNRSPSGACRARNDGIAASSGKYIAFLDDDDYWRPEKIQVQVEALQAAGETTALIYTGLEIVDTRENHVKYRRAVYRGSILPELLVENVINTLSSVLIRRSALEEAGGFDTAFPSRQDLDLFIRVAQKYNIDFVPGPLTCYTNLFNESISKDYQKKLRGRALILQKYAHLYKGRRRLVARYHYGTAKLSLKHSDKRGALQWLCISIKAYPSLRAVVRYAATLIKRKPKHS